MHHTKTLFHGQYSILHLLGLLMLLAGCRSATESKPTEAVFKAEQANELNSTETYQAYSTEAQNTTGSLPVLIAIDSQGRSDTAIAHLKLAAKNYPAILVASKRIKNNNAHYEQELNSLIAGIRKDYPNSGPIYLIGFSGGARMALSYAANHQVAGVMACSAFAPAEQLAAVPCPVVGLAGMHDFNFTELAKFVLWPSEMPGNVHVELLQGLHEWPAPERLSDAWAWFWLQHKKVDNDRLKQYTTAQLQRLDTLEQQGAWLQAICLGRKLASVEAFEQAGQFNALNESLEQHPAYHAQRQALMASLKFEMNKRELYKQALLTKKQDWWAMEIGSLLQQAEHEPNIMKRMAYKRLSGFIGIICYSYASQLATQKNPKQLSKVLMVYRLAEPNNPDLHNFEATLASMNTKAE